MGYRQRTAESNARMVVTLESGRELYFPLSAFEILTAMSVAGVGFTGIAEARMEVRLPGQPWPDVKKPKENDTPSAHG